MVVSQAELSSRILDCLDRRVTINAVVELRRAAAGERSPDPHDPKSIAIGLDTNTIFKFGTDRSNTDAVDYLASRHAGPLILPGQVIQEFWNNRLSAIDTQADVLRTRYKTLAEEVLKLEDSFGEYHSRFQLLLDEFRDNFSFAFDSNTASRIGSILTTLQNRSIVAFVPRAMFADLAAIRDQTKTPPGFKDSGHGDFYVWADFLLGLLSARDDGALIDKAVLITGDEKVDWSRGGQAHPILVAEANALLGIPFETWSLSRFREFVSVQLAQVPTGTADIVVEAEPTA